MSSLNANDRLSLCLFSFSDGRRCRTPRIANHPHFCFYHAQKEAQAQAAETLGHDLAYFFSGNYLSACDLSAALGRLIPAVVRGELKPKLARTVAYLMQTLMQTIHLSQHEYINSFGADGWRKAVRTSVETNHNHLFPPTPAPGNSQPRPPAPAHPSQNPTPTPPPQQSPQTSPSPTPTPPPSSTSARAGTSVGAGTSVSVAAGLAHPAPSSSASSNQRPSPADTEAALRVARSIFPPRPNSTTPQPADSQPTAPQPNNESHAAPPHPQQRPGAPHRDPYAVHYDHTYTLRVDGKPF